jgi:EAL domain-containing protein (putative c-di-GMP-specific phosphodiesterase class I)
MVTVSATCGLVRLDSGNSDGAEVLKQAHVALKLAKSQYRGASVYYNDEMGTDAAERSALLRRLREAFEADRLFVVYQPQVRLADRSIVGAEALLRWRSEEGLFVPPDLFIPVAEKSGLMVTIGEFVLRSACHQLKKLNEAGFADFRMSVNVSQAQFRDPRFVQTVKRALVDSGVSAVNLELEITESMAAEDLDFVLSVLHELKSAGVTIAIDDFGTGYSSLSILGRLPLDRLKIDKSFVDDLGVTEGVAKSIIDIGRSLKLELIAEGVEKAEQADALHALGCQEGQGYLYACPLPAEELHHWLASH